MSTFSKHSSIVTASTWLIVALMGASLAGCAAESTTSADEEPETMQSELLLPIGAIDKPVIFKPYPFPLPTPFPAPDPEELLDITAGNSHTCVRKRNGNVYCWGRDDLGQAGQLPSATCQSSPGKCVDRPKQIYSVAFPGAAQLDAGNEHACALDASGKAYCWGDSSYGQLGIGVNGYKSEPVAVVGGLTFTSLSAGTYGTCAATSDGLFCWGYPIASGASGSGSGFTSPQRIYSATGLAPTGVSAGYAGVCAQWVQGAYRETNCWGRNWEGQTGSAPSAFTLLGQGPTLVGSSVQRVVTQSLFTCVDQPGPTVQCFGAGTSGQLGGGASVSAFAPQTVVGPNGQPLALRGVSTGQYHACALDPNGAAYCWGYGSYGQLGNGLPPNGGPGISTNKATPVVGGLTFRAIAAGERHTCAIGTNNKIYCWGSNYHGQLGTQYKSPNQPYTNGWVADPVQTLDPI